MIVAADGYILTNNHVVDNASQVKVTLPDGREFTAKVVGRDPKSDIAVVKIDAKGLPVVPMADSAKVQVGDVVLAIGNPFGVGQTVTAGIGFIMCPRVITQSWRCIARRARRKRRLTSRTTT